MIGKTGIQKLVRTLGYEITRLERPERVFHENRYLRHNARRLEHLCSLRIPVATRTVLEVGAGIGDHSEYYIDRGCRLTITEVRPSNLEYLRERYPTLDIRSLDMENPTPVDGGPFGVVHCYGLLYHVSKPDEAIEFLSKQTGGTLLLETCVSYGHGDEMHPVSEPQELVSSAWSGTGCRPTRSWVYRQLQKHFQHVYVPRTQPYHEEFPLDWSVTQKQHTWDLKRAIFVASRQRLDIDTLTDSLPMTQRRHD